MRLLPFLLLSACLAPGRERITVPVQLSAAERGPWTTDEATIALDRAVITTARLYVYESDTAALLGAWDGERRANLLGFGSPHGDVDLWEGDYAHADFEITDLDPVELEGVATVGEEDVPFALSLEVTGRIAVDFEATIDREAPPSSLAWTVDLGTVLGAVDWAAEAGDDGLTEPDGDVAERVTAAILAPETWALAVP